MFFDMFLQHLASNAVEPDVTLVWIRQSLSPVKELLLVSVALS